MTTSFKSPGVYLAENDGQRPVIAQLETALPAFIGYTERAADSSGVDRTRKPTPITSVADFERTFGGPAVPALEVAATLDQGTDLARATVSPPKNPFLLAHAVQHYFANGGQRCVVVSVGAYAEGGVVLGDTQRGLRSGLEVVRADAFITLIVIPEAVLLDEAGYSSLVQAMLEQCAELQNRFALLDLREGDQAKSPERVARDRKQWGPQHLRLRYGAAYHPWLRTTMHHPLAPSDAGVQVRLNGAEPVPLAPLKQAQPSVYNAVKAALTAQTVVLPPSAALAGLCAATDRERGVWKAPANRSLRDVLEPMVALNPPQQELLALDAAQGRSINVILSFPGRGSVVWGARTLAGNDNEWRFVPVRRFFNGVEASIKAGTAWLAFAPNEKNTWSKLSDSVETFLTDLWRHGALQGAQPKQAFFVKCGLGPTMTKADVAAGRLILEVGLAVLKPAEFITFRITLVTMQA
jgi:uncharacterized protein